MKLATAMTEMIIPYATPQVLKTSSRTSLDVKLEEDPTLSNCIIVQINEKCKQN